MDRRTFLKMAGMGSVAFTAGCSDPKKNLFTLVHAPDDMVTGQPTWYASTCRECPAGCGVLAKNREGRVIKLEGNPLHPVNRGKLCIRGQAGLQGVFDPDRLRTPLRRLNGEWKPLTFDEALDTVRKKGVEAGSGNVRMVTGVVGETLQELMADAMGAWGAAPPTVYEPYAYEDLKAANRAVFGIDGLFAYRMEEADYLLSFGADFLETWLSPVEYARKFKAMHRYKSGAKGAFVHVGPYRGLTGANADRWVSCFPGSEAALALGMLQVAVDVGRAAHLPGRLRKALERMVDPYNKETVVARCGIAPEEYDALAAGLFQAERPLVLGPGNAGAGGNTVQAHLAANLLNAVLDPGLERLEFGSRYRVESASPRAEVLSLFENLQKETRLLLLHDVDPVYSLPAASGVAEAIQSEATFVVAFSASLNDTAAMADLVVPVAAALEGWDEYAGRSDACGVLQPAMGRTGRTPSMGDALLQTCFGEWAPAPDYKTYLAERMNERLEVASPADWAGAFQRGGVFDRPAPAPAVAIDAIDADVLEEAFSAIGEPSRKTTLIAAPSIRHFDGRTANRPWTSEIPDSLTQIAWQTPVVMHPRDLAEEGLETGDRVRLENAGGAVEGPVLSWDGVRPGVVMVSVGQGHGRYGRYASGLGANPFGLLPLETDPLTGGPRFCLEGAALEPARGKTELASLSGSTIQHDRKIALSVPIGRAALGDRGKPGLTMHDFPMTLPIPKGYDTHKRDIYPAHEHEGYRWAMVVDLDRCIGCSACAAACYAENNLAVVGEKRILEGREMAWLQVQRYVDPEERDAVTFLPMMCQHCDNAPCESVCPVYAPHHSKEGLNNQIYNRCIGTRFCSQNCPYKVRRFNWFTYTWPDPMHLQLNPDVTVRSKGVMEKCSFCIQRIKEGHNVAKNEKRQIRDGEVVPACVQTCPTDALVFGNLMDPASRVRRLVRDPRAYQVMGYLNTKPAVIYLKKVTQEV